jgi:phosphoribosyl 1,2-cyclic phosphate phosphodiesterase
LTAPGRVAFLGTGTSHGVPIIGCRCAVCVSEDPRDKRTRPSILITGPSGQVLVDTSPDFRQQALRHGIDRLDGVLFTHSHADHIMGFDDLRRFNHIQGTPVPCYAAEATWSDLRQTFHYVFADKPRTGGGVPEIAVHVIDGPLTVGGMRIVPVPLWHGQMRVLGFRTGGFAYLTDCNRLDDAAWPLLEGVDTLVLDALRDKPHSTHFTVREALEVLTRLAPRRAYLTHMTHDLGHRETSARLPAGVELAYDGLVIDVAVAPE